MSEFSTLGVLSPVISDVWDRECLWTLGTYRDAGGYEGLVKTRSYGPDELTQFTKDPSLAGHGGAGFPTDLRWSSLPPPDGGPRYPVVNADESGLGTCRDVPVFMGNPYALIEGMAICLLAVGGHHGFVYLREGVVHAYRRLMVAARQTREAGLIGKTMGSDGDYDIEITVHVGAGVYICGEETALLSPLEGRHGQPHLKPPFPAAEGLYARPTVINNAETISSVPGTVRSGVGWFHAMGTESAKGHGFFSSSGHVKNPGQYEASPGITARTFLDLAGDIRPRHELKFWAVGGSSVPLFIPEQLGVSLDYNSVREAGPMLATRAITVFGETVSVVRVTSRWTGFYQHESCGKRTPRREGTYWMWRAVHRSEAGRGRPGDADLLYKITSDIADRSFCALDDAAATPAKSGTELFREESEAGYTALARELFPYEKTILFSEVSVQ